MSYTHHYPMLLRVPHMLETSRVGLSRAKVAAALRVLAGQVEAGTDAQLEQLLGREPINAERDDSWVLRKIAEKNMVMQDGLSFQNVSTAEISREHIVPADDAVVYLRQMRVHANKMFESSIFARPENIGYDPLILEFRDDRHGVTFRTDMTDFLAEADLDLLTEFQADCWRVIENGEVLGWFLEHGDPAALAFEQVSLDYPVHPDDQHPSLVCEVIDKEAATAALKDLRSDFVPRVRTGEVAETPGL